MFVRKKELQKILDVYEDRIEKLERKVWFHENPAKFKVMDKVYYNRWKHKVECLVIGIEINKDPYAHSRYSRKYNILNQETGDMYNVWDYDICKVK